MRRASRSEGLLTRNSASSSSCFGSRSPSRRSPPVMRSRSASATSSSSLLATRIANDAIRVGEGTFFVAGGVESITRPRSHAFPAEDATPRFIDEQREDFVNHYYLPMGLTAENVAERFGVTREAMDE